MPHEVRPNELWRDMLQRKNIGVKSCGTKNSDNATPCGYMSLGHAITAVATVCTLIRFVPAVSSMIKVPATFSLVCMKLDLTAASCPRDM